MSKSELMQQCDSRWEIYDKLLSSKSWQMLDVQMAAFGASTAFTAVDWLVLFVGFGTVKFCVREDGCQTVKPLFEQDVIFKGIDESSLFDDALHNTRILKFMFQSTSALYSSYTITYAMRLCAHAFAKCPQLENHSANFGRNRDIGRFQRVTYSKAKAFL